MRLAALLAVMLLGACGEGDDGDPTGVPGSGGEGGGSSDPDACKPKCDGADDRSTFQTDGYQSVTCVWLCKGNKYISETYEDRRGCWTLASRYTSTPLCD